MRFCAVGRRGTRADRRCVSTCVGPRRSVPKLSMDANGDPPAPPLVPTVVADILANGDQRTPLESRRQLEAIHNPLQLEAIAKEGKKDHKEEKLGPLKEAEQGNARHTHGNGSEVEKMRLDFEMALLKHQHEENDRQRQHEEKMEQIRQQSPSRTGSHGEEQRLVSKLDPITEIELEKMRMEFELAKLKQISEENEKQRRHEQRMYEEKEKQRQHEEKMERLHQRHGSFRVVSQKAAVGGLAEAAGEASSVALAEAGKMRIEVQLAVEVCLPETHEQRPPCEVGRPRESPKAEPRGEPLPEAGNPPEQQNDGVTEHLGLQVPRIVVNGAEPEWSSSRLDLAIETELEKRRMEFELTRLKYEHDENERQRQHEEKMEQLRQQGPPKAVQQQACPNEEGVP